MKNFISCLSGRKSDLFHFGVLSILISGGVFVIYALVGINDVLSWRFGIRNFLLGVLTLFLTECVSGVALSSIKWRISLVVFYLYACTIPFILAASSDLANIRIEATNSYFQMGLGLGVLLFLLLQIDKIVNLSVWIGKLAVMICICIASANLLVYLVYFGVFGTAFTVADMITLLLSNLQEAQEFLSSHIGWEKIIGTLMGFALYLFAFFYFMQWTTKNAEDEVAERFVKWQKIGCCIIAIGAIVMGNHWLFKSFPLYEYQKASSYIRSLHRLEANHENYLNNLTILAPDNTLAQKLPGTVIVVIGESANRDHMKAFNPQYQVETTPWLSQKRQEDGFYLYDQAYSNYPLTHESLAMYLTNQNQYDKSTVDQTVTITDVANKAGYKTAWISNQVPSGGVLSLLATESDVEFWVKPSMSSDKRVLEYLKTLPQNKNESQFIVIHLAGSHDRYNARYPADYPEFQKNAEEKVNEYDTSIAYTDEVLKEIFEYASQNMNLQVMTYCSDHGEDMTYFHGGSKFTFDMVRVPLFIYLSPEYQKKYPETAENLKRNLDCVFTNDLMYDTISGLIKAENSCYEKNFDLSSAQYTLTKETALTKGGKIRILDDCN